MKSTTRLHAIGVLGLVETRTRRGDPRVAAHVGHLGHHQPRAANRTAAKMHDVPVAHRPVVSHVLAHR